MKRTGLGKKLDELVKSGEEILIGKEQDQEKIGRTCEKLAHTVQREYKKIK